MPEPAELSAARRRAVDTLRVAEGIAGYAARSLGNGLEPGAARRAALEAAADLERAAAALRRLARPNPVADPGAAIIGPVNEAVPGGVRAPVPGPDRKRGAANERVSRHARRRARPV